MLLNQYWKLEEEAKELRQQVKDLRDQVIQQQYGGNMSELNRDSKAEMMSNYSAGQGWMRNKSNQSLSPMPRTGASIHTPATESNKLFQMRSQAQDELIQS